MNWKFWKRQAPPEAPKTPIDMRVWNEDWQVGDTAECVVGPEAWKASVLPWERLAKGSRWIVTGFCEAESDGGVLEYCLSIEGAPLKLYSTRAFRKVRPQSIEQSEIAQRILKSKNPGPDRVREPDTASDKRGKGELLNSGYSGVIVSRVSKPGERSIWGSVRGRLQEAV